MSNPRYLSRADAEALAQKVLSFSTADEARVNMGSGAQGNTRFAQNQVSTGGDAYDASVTVTSAFGNRRWARLSPILKRWCKNPME